MTGLSGEIEDHLLVGQQSLERKAIANIRKVYAYTPFIAGQIMHIPAIFRNHAVDDSDLCAQIAQADRQRGTDESQAASDQDPTIFPAGT
jgi:hypothetical protein